MISVKCQALKEDFLNIQLQLLKFHMAQHKSWVTGEEQFPELFARWNAHTKNCRGQIKIEIILPNVPCFFLNFFPWYLPFTVTLASSGVTCCYHKRIHLRKCGWGFMLSREVTFRQKSFVQPFPLQCRDRMTSSHDAKEEYGCCGKGKTAFPAEADMLFLLQKTSGLSKKGLNVW